MFALVLLIEEASVKGIAYLSDGEFFETFDYFRYMAVCGRGQSCSGVDAVQDSGDRRQCMRTIYCVAINYCRRIVNCARYVKYMVGYVVQCDVIRTQRWLVPQDTRLYNVIIVVNTFLFSLYCVCTCVLCSVS